MPVGFDKVTVFNMALSHVGAKGRGVEDADESTSVASACRTWYLASQLETLEAYNWAFARGSKALATHDVAAPTVRWAYRYQLPSDYVAARYLENPLGPDHPAVPYEIENAGDGTLCLCTDLDEAVLIYTKAVEELDLWTMHAVIMLSVRLGYNIDNEIAGKVSNQTRLEKQFERLRERAPIAEAQTEVFRKPPDARTIQSRA